MRKRTGLVPIVLPVLVIGVLGLGYLVDLLPSRGETLSGSRSATRPTTERPLDQEGDFAKVFAHGVDRFQRGQFSAATRLFETASRLRPRVPEAQVNLGYAYLKTGNSRAAEAAFRRAIDLRPTQVNAYFGWAESLEQLGNLADAKGAMRTYLHLSPRSDPFRRRALAAVWEWETVGAPDRQDISAPGPDDLQSPLERGGPSHPNLDGLKVERLDGKVERLGEFAGMALVLNIWASWCAPCRAELPSLQKLSEILARDNLAVAGVSVDEDADLVREYLLEVGVTFPNYLDSRGKAVRDAFGVTSYPVTLLIGPNGDVRKRLDGMRDWTAPETVRLVRNALTDDERPARGGSRKSFPTGRIGAETQPAHDSKAAGSPSNSGS